MWCPSPPPPHHCTSDEELGEKQRRATYLERLPCCPKTWALTACPQPVFDCGRLYSVLVTVSASKYSLGFSAMSLSASSSVSALTAQVRVILKYFMVLSPPLLQRLLALLTGNRSY